MTTTPTAPGAPVPGPDPDDIVLDRRGLDEVLHVIDLHSDVLMTWDYERSRPALVKLYEKAKSSQWNASTDLPWDTDVDIDRLGPEMSAAADRFQALRQAPDSPLAAWGPVEWSRFAVEMQTWTMSQFLHGEQGALVCTGLITSTVPWIDAKYYAATQVMDEARHVEVFARYLEDKLGGSYPINPQLAGLLDDIVRDGRWDITYLGMQIMVEGLALAAFGFMHMLTGEPLLKKLLRYVMSDEARHVAFGVLSLKEFYEGLSADEIRSRQEFAYEAALLLRNRFFAQDVWERLGADPRAVIRFLRDNDDPGAQVFQQMLFSKIVPNCKKLGLLDAGDGWLRQRFTEIGIIQFEDWTDTSEEYGALDAVAADRA
ncbi:MAG TPA: ferritin-like domain-containing protein [Acidimicrobiales bacterium]